MREIKMTVYNYNELSDEAKQKSLNNLIDWKIEMFNMYYGTDYISEENNIYKAYKKTVEMDTPWFFGSYIYEYCKEELEEELNMYEYFEDGTIYCEKE